MSYQDFRQPLFNVGINVFAIDLVAEMATTEKSEIQFGDWLYKVAPRDGWTHLGKPHDPSFVASLLNAGPVLEAFEAENGLVQALHDKLGEPYVIPCVVEGGEFDVTVAKRRGLDDETLAAYAEGRLTVEERAQAEATATPADRAAARDLFGIALP